MCLPLETRKQSLKSQILCTPSQIKINIRNGQKFNFE